MPLLFQGEVTFAIVHRHTDNKFQWKLMLIGGVIIEGEEWTESNARAMLARKVAERIVEW